MTRVRPVGEIGFERHFPKAALPSATHESHGCARALTLAGNCVVIFRWLLPGALVVLLPKCLGCLVAYVAVGSSLGLVGRELCGADLDGAGPTGLWTWVMFAAIGGVISLLLQGIVRRRTGVPRSDPGPEKISR